MLGNGFLLERADCDKLLKQTDIRLMLTKSHLVEYSDPSRDSSSEIVKALCELFIALDGLAESLRIAQTGAVQRHNGAEHYLISEEEGFLIQSLYLPMVLELKDRTALLGVSLTIN
jgi:hypothetical protein